MSANVFPADYATVPVYEYTTKEGSFILRRQSDSYINVTHLLNIAGLPRKEIRSILDEICNKDKFEKVNVGNWKYQGTYIPLQSAVKIAKDVSIYDKVEPIFDIDLPLNMPTQPVNTSSIDPPSVMPAQSGASVSPVASAAPKRKIKEQEKSRKRQLLAATEPTVLPSSSSGPTEATKPKPAPKVRVSADAKYPRPIRDKDQFLKNDDALFAIFTVLYENDPKGLGIPIKHICIALLEAHPAMRSLAKNFSAFVSGRLLFYLRKINSKTQIVKYMIVKEFSRDLNAFVYKYLGEYKGAAHKVLNDAVPEVVLQKRKEKADAKVETQKQKPKQKQTRKEKQKPKEKPKEKVNERGKRKEKAIVARSKNEDKNTSGNKKEKVKVTQEPPVEAESTPSQVTSKISNNSTTAKDSKKESATIKAQKLELNRLQLEIEALKSSLENVTKKRHENVLVDELKLLKVEVNHLSLNFDKLKGKLAMQSLFKRNTELSKNNSRLEEENYLLKEKISLLKNEKMVLEKSAVEKGSAEIESLESELDAEIQNVEQMIAVDESLKTEVSRLPRTDTLIGGYKQLVETRILFQERKFQQQQMELEIKVKHLLDEIAKLKHIINETYKLVQFKDEVISVDKRLIEEYQIAYK